MAIRKKIESAVWTVQRFGFSPRKLVSRIFDQGLPSIYCVSVPKSGTHLLERALCMHPGLFRKFKPTIDECNLDPESGLGGVLSKMGSGEIVMSHLFSTPERLQAVANSGIRCIFMIRDPRDIALSEALYLSRKRKHRFHMAYHADKDLSSRIGRSLLGSESAGLPPIGEILDGLSGWLDSGCLVVRFEDLIGPEGGGDLQSQLDTLRSIYDHIGIQVSDDWLRSIRARLFSSASPTFRRGSTGQWKEYYDTELIALFKKMAGESLVRYGYEKDGNW